MKTTGCNVDKVTILPNALITPLISSSMIKTEDVTPMEVTSEKRSSPIFQVSYVMNAPYLSHIRKIAIFPFLVLLASVFHEMWLMNFAFQSKCFIGQ
jgi:hypothetical protein